MRATRLRLHGLFTALLVLTGVLLSGCSMVRVGYNQADTLLSWMAHDYFDLDATLKDCMVWREEEILATEILSQAVPGSKFYSCHYREP